MLFCVDMEPQIKVSLSPEEVNLILFLLSREVIEYRKTPYQGVVEYVDSCLILRKKIKRRVRKEERTPNSSL